MPTGRELLNVIEAKHDEFKRKPIKTFWTNIFSGFAVSTIEPIKTYLSANLETDFSTNSNKLMHLIQLLISFNDPFSSVLKITSSSGTSYPSYLKHVFSYSYENTDYASFQFLNVLLKKLFNTSKIWSTQNSVLASPIEYPEIDAISFLHNQRYLNQENLFLLQKMHNPRDGAIAIHLLSTKKFLSQPKLEQF